MAKILVLGASGMLGLMVFDYFISQTDHQVKGTVRRQTGKEKFFQKYGEDNFYFFNVEGNMEEQLVEILEEFRPDYAINCIGVIKPYCKDNDMAGVERAIRINALFPYYLAQVAKAANVKVIQIATDCVYSGKDGKYAEKSPHDALDVYGKTKSLGEVKSPNFLHLRCSIIGPKLKDKLSLLEWFLNQPAGAELKGFSHHQWNGVTTLQFAQLCADIINKGKEHWQKLVTASLVHHCLPNRGVNKYELLSIFNEVFTKGFKILEVNNIGPAVDRTLGSDFNLLPREIKEMKTAIQELKDYTAKRDFCSV